MAMKIASRKKKIPSIAKRDPEGVAEAAHEPRPEQPELEGEDGAGDGADGEQHRDRLRPVAGEAKRVRVVRLRPRHSAISIIAGKATPKQASTMWKPRVNAIWLRAASRFDEESANREMGKLIGVTLFPRRLLGRL